MYMKKEFIIAKQQYQLSLYQTYLQEVYEKVLIDDRNIIEGISSLWIIDSKNMSFSIVFIPNMEEQLGRVQLMQFTFSVGFITIKAQQENSLLFFNKFNEISALGHVFLNNTGEAILKSIVPVSVFDAVDAETFLEMTKVFYFNCKLFKSAFTAYQANPEQLDQIIADLIA